MDNNLIKNTSIVGIGTVISRIAGYVREIAQNAWMGTSAVSDALIIATRIPTLLRKISTEGSLNGVLIPLIDDLEKKHHPHTITNLINKIIIIFSAAFLVFFVFEITYAKESLKILAPGILKDPERLYWFHQYIPFTSLTIVFFFLNGVFSAILNYNQQFFWPAIAPLFWNFTLISFMIVGLYYDLDFYIIGPAFLIATIIQCLVTFIPYSKLGIPFRIKKDVESKDVLKTFFKSFFPVMFSASISQINSMILIILTSFLPIGNTTLLYRAERLLQVPIALILALSTTLLPTLTKMHNKQDSSKTIKSSLLLSASLFIPISLIFYIWPLPIVKSIFNYGKCKASDINTIAQLLRIYSFGIPAFLLLRIMPIFFFARKEINVTTKGAVIHTVSNIILSITLMQNFQGIGLALASVLSSWLHILWLSINIIKKKYII